jgi:hypothetical protein
VCAQPSILFIDSTIDVPSHFPERCQSKMLWLVVPNWPLPVFKMLVISVPITPNSVHIDSDVVGSWRSTNKHNKYTRHGNHQGCILICLFRGTWYKQYGRWDQATIPRAFPCACVHACSYLPRAKQGRMCLYTFTYLPKVYGPGLSIFGSEYFVRAWLVI